MKILYIGIYDNGSTSKMRGETIKQILKPEVFDVINTSNSSFKINRLFLSLGWRCKVGPLIWAINEKINNYKLSFYDIIWVDKGVFIKPNTIKKLKQITHKLVHYTPDPAFFYHRSSLFYKQIPLYDYLVTTKSFEIDNYYEYGAKKVILTSQGYDPNIHKPHFDFDSKKGISFIGHWEQNREEIIKNILDEGFDVYIAGIKWERFCNRFEKYKNLHYYGTGIFGDDYAKLISKSLFSIGFLSKIIPELHTTRTFEIPACGTALITEFNEETKKFFSEDEVIFYNSSKDLIEKIKYYSNNMEIVHKITELGQKRVAEKGYDYHSIIEKILQEILK